MKDQVRTIVHRVAPIALATVCAAAVLAAQQSQQPVFRTVTNHVTVDVIATDGDGRPVTDLRAEDFEIWQGGVRQTVADFEHVLIPMADRQVDLTATLPPPPDTFTNAPPPRSARAFVFLFWSLSTENIVPIKKMMASFLGALQPVDEVAIVYPRRSDLSQDFTSDPGRLVQAVNSLREAFEGSKTGGSLRLWIDTMQNLLRSLDAAREQRHVIVMVSEGFVSFEPPPNEIRATLTEAIRRNIPVYTIDPRGLMAPELNLGGRIENQTPEARMAVNRSITASKDGLRGLALSTNGRPFVDNWNVPQAAADLIGDNNSYYLLGFYPAPYEQDGKFHGIDVKVKRPGVKIRAREGYTSEPPPDKLKPKRLVDRLGDGMPGGDLVLRATAAPLLPDNKGASTLLSVDVEYPDEWREPSADQAMACARSLRK